MFHYNISKKALQNLIFWFVSNSFWHYESLGEKISTIKLLKKLRYSEVIRPYWSVQVNLGMNLEKIFIDKETVYYTQVKQKQKFL